MTRVVTANLHANMSLRKTLSDVRRLLKVGKPDVIGFQEIGGTGRMAAMAVVLLAHGYAVSRTLPEPIAYRRRKYRKRRSFKWFLTPAAHVGAAGAGPSTLREKHAMVLVLGDRVTGQVEIFANAHLAPSISLPRRDALHRKQMDGLAALAQHLRTHHPKAILYFFGDYNTSSPERFRPLTAEGLQPGADVHTHGHSAIDRVFSDVEMKRSAIGGLHSDHDGLLAVS